MHGQQKDEDRECGAQRNKVNLSFNKSRAHVSCGRSKQCIYISESLMSHVKYSSGISRSSAYSFECIVFAFVHVIPGVQWLQQSLNNLVEY